MNDRREQCPAENLQVTRISETEWRVADDRVSDTSPSKVLGFVQQRGEAFEVLNLHVPDRDEFFESWNSAIGSFADPSGSASATVTMATRARQS